MQFTHTQIRAGVWQGALAGAGDTAPDLRITYLGQPLDQVTYERDTTSDVWRVRITLPQEMLSEGVQTCVISDGNGNKLDTFSIICGAPLADDLRAEISLLRAELELLQHAFRKHCAET